MSNIVQELEAQIKNASTAAVSENVGTIKAIGDGVARIEGLSNAMLNEMIEFPGGVMGLAMNLEENEVGAVLIGNGKLQGYVLPKLTAEEEEKLHASAKALKKVIAQIKL